jgi:hypothetical protein
VLAVRDLDRRAGAALNEFPGVALEVDGRRALTGRAGAGGAVILSLQGDAVAFLFVGGDGGLPFGLRERRSGGDGGERAGNGAGEDERADKGSGGHWAFSTLVAAPRVRFAAIVTPCAAHGLLNGSGGLAGVHHGEVDIGLCDFIDVVGQGVQRDMEHDLDDLRIAVASETNIL